MHSVPVSRPSSAEHHINGKARKRGSREQEQRNDRDFQQEEGSHHHCLPPPPPIHVHQKGGTRVACKKPKPFSKSTVGYDRRAQLLPYAKVLRNGDREQPQWPKNIPKPKHEMGRKRLNAPVRIQGTTRNRKRYWRLMPDVDIPCKPKSITGRKKKKKKGIGDGDSRFVGRLRGIPSGFCRD